MGKQFKEYFSIIEYDEHDNELFNRVLEVRVDPKDKEINTGGKGKGKGEVGKASSMYEENEQRQEIQKDRKKRDTDSIFGK